MSVYFTSDWHFGHKKMFGPGCYSTVREQFATVDEMNEALAAAIRSTVSENDVLYHLGDISFTSVAKTIEWVESLGTRNIVFIRGNHDDNKMFRRLSEAGFVCLEEAVFKHVDNGKPLNFTLTHYPRSVEGHVVLSGHIHNEVPVAKDVLNVGVDCVEIYECFEDKAFGTPLSIDEVVALTQYHNAHAKGGDVEAQGFMFNRREADKRSI